MCRRGTRLLSLTLTQSVLHFRFCSRLQHTHALCRTQTDARENVEQEQAALRTVPEESPPPGFSALFESVVLVV